MSTRSKRTTTKKRKHQENENLADHPVHGQAGVSAVVRRSSRKSSSQKGLQESTQMNVDTSKAPVNRKTSNNCVRESNEREADDTSEKNCTMITESKHEKWDRDGTSERKHGSVSGLPKFPAHKENVMLTSGQQGLHGLSLVDSGRSLLHQLHRKMLGSRRLFTDPYQQKPLSVPLRGLLKDMMLQRTASPFDRRCTAMEWHPSNPDLLAVGSKGGDVIIWNTEAVDAVEKDIFIEGRGPGGSIQAMKFWPHNTSQLVTASIDGTVTLHDLESKHSHALLDTLNCLDHWFCSLDVSDKLNLLAAGDNSGFVCLRSLNGENIWKKRLHKNKVTHVEFSPREPWLMCTASLEHAVKLWDIRMIKDKTSMLISLPHEKGVNSAYFNRTDGTKLLTTDQYREIRVYSLPHACLETTIQHPHRFFQHITPIKAEWHPLQDLIVVGRYPEEGFPGYSREEKRTVDIIDAQTGHMVCQLNDPAAPGIISLNKFSHQGDRLASCMGVNILIWNRQEVLIEKQA